MGSQLDQGLVVGRQKRCEVVLKVVVLTLFFERTRWRDAEKGGRGKVVVQVLGV